MKPDKLSVYQLFEAQRRHVVPLFQRPYVWNQEDHWEPLWEDILRQAEAEGRNEIVRPHFLGAVVLNQLPTVARDLDTREIIDGQQRLTTLQVCLAAARRLAEEGGYTELGEEFGRLTVNPRRSSSHDPFKIRTTRSDHEVFSAVMRGLTPDDLRAALGERARGKDTPRLAAAYLFFLEQLRAYLSDGRGDRPEGQFWSFYEALRKRLQLVVIDLEDTDDPQIIFETLNARGVPLLPSDLIRNFVLHRARERGFQIDELYDRWWRELDERADDAPYDGEPLFWKKEVRQGRLTRPRLDLFFFHFLQHESQREFNITRLYQEFGEWWENNWSAEVEEGLQRIRSMSDLFAHLIEPKGSSRESLFLQRLAVLDTSTLYPLLMELLGPKATWEADGDRERALVDLESFLVRRLICRLTTKNYNRFFMSLLRQVSGGSCSSAVIRERLLASEDDTARWPDDTEFKRAWTQLAAGGYIRQDRLRMVLGAIERRLYDPRQEGLWLDSQTTLEHVMPQNWERSWRLPANAARTVVGDDGETMLQRRQRLLQTFGNLTLLTQKLNSTVSNGPYPKKRREIVKQSLLKLNTYFQDVERWDEDEILRRGEHLFNLARTVWPHPSRGAAE